MSTNPNRLKVFTEEEIDSFLMGDRRSIDRLLLHGINNLSIVIIDHAEREEEIFKGMGSAETIKKRSDWIDSEIEKKRIRTDMMNKVVTSTMAWAVIAFVGYLVHIAADSILAWYKARNGT